jgi:hypothetical protein
MIRRRFSRLAAMALVVLVAAGAGRGAAPNPFDSPGCEWARPWKDNSIQPPPDVQPAKLPQVTPQPGDGETERIYRAAIAWFDWAIEHIDQLVPAAEKAAPGLIDGGRMFAAGNAGWVQEFYGRAGGFSFLSDAFQEHTTTVAPKDLIMIGMTTPRDECGWRLDFSTLTTGGGWNYPCTVVHFAGHQWPLIGRTLPLVRRQNWGGRLFLIDTGAPTGSSWSDVSLQQMAATAMGWAFCGELFAAATRKGKTLASWASDCEPNGRDWDKTVEGLNLHPKAAVPPIPAGQIARQYLRICQRQVAEFLDAGEARRVRQAGQRLAATLSDGKACFIVVCGHLHVRGAVIPREFTNMVMYGRTWEWRPQVIRPGDMLLWLGYLDYPAAELEKVLAAGGKAVTLTASDGPTDDSRININGHWDKWDSAVNVAGLPVRILPTSGVVQTPQWYALMAEALKDFRAAPCVPAAIP